MAGRRPAFYLRCLPIGFMLVTGMVIGTAFTLFVVPSIYVLVAGTRKVTVAADAGEKEAAMPELAGAAG
jgi:hypothetical protein